MIAETLKRALDGHDLGRDEMHRIVGEVMDGNLSDVQKSALLVALRMKGETVDELTGAATAMRERVRPLDIDREGLVDTCGTGGDGSGSFNISTAAALVAAGAGVRVAKHGNRAVSSKCGSADVLAELGVNVDVEPREIGAVLRRAGIAFLFAPKLHPAMREVADVRRQLGVRTVFNVVGPLTNPAFARRQVIGVYSAALVETVAQVLAALGAEHALVVHGHDGMDEISIAAPTAVAEVRDGAITRYDVTPDELGLRQHRSEALTGGDPRENAAIIRRVLGGARGAARDIVAANAGAAIYVAGRTATIRDGVALADESIRSGRAAAKLELLIEATNELAGAA